MCLSTITKVVVFFARETKKKKKKTKLTLWGMVWSIFYSGLATFCNEKAKPDVWHHGPYLFSTLSSFFLSPSSFNSFFIARVWLRPISGLASCRDIILFSSVNEDTEFFKSTSSQTPRFVLFIPACLLTPPNIHSSILHAVSPVKPYAAAHPTRLPCPVSPPPPPPTTPHTSHYQVSCWFIKWIHRRAFLQGRFTFVCINVHFS